MQRIFISSTPIKHCISLYLLAFFATVLIPTAFATADDTKRVTFTLYAAENITAPAQPHPSLQAMLKQASWTPSKKNAIYLEPNGNTSWVAVKIQNTSMQRQSRLFELSNTKIQAVEVYQAPSLHHLDEAKLIYKQAGLNQAFSSRPIHHRNPVYPVDIDSNDSLILLLKFNHHHNFKLHANLWKTSNFEKSNNRELVFFGMIYGIIFMLAMYNLFVYLSLKEKSHLLFVVFGLFTGLFISMQEGHFAQFVAINSLWPKDLFFGISTAMMCFSSAFLCAYFLDLERWSMTLFKIMLLLGSMSAMLLILLSISNQPIILSHNILLIIIAVYAFAVAASFYVWHQNVPSAGFFSLAILLSTLGLVADFLVQLPHNDWIKLSYSYSSLGCASMIMVFAFAFAKKMKRLHDEKLQASLKLIKMTEEKAQNNLEIYKTKLNEIELEKKADEAKIESRAKGEFLATMSHEIRTPMNGILGMTELLADTNLNEGQKQFTTSITNSSKALLNAINDLLDYSKIQSGIISLESKLFNLEKIIDDCISIFALRASEAKINFIGRVNPDCDLIYRGDADKIRQITLNLLANAFNFSHHGDIFIHAYKTGKNTVNSAEIRIDISRSGIILSEQEKASLFKPFDVNKNNKRHYKHEIGLTVSKELIELMQGDIGIKTDNDSTTLWFTVRLLTPNKKDTFHLIDRTKILSGRRLLICDENTTFINSVKTLTESWGMEVFTANHSKNATEQLLEDTISFQILMIAEELLTPEVERAIKQSNIEHNFTTSIILVTKSRFAISQEDMKRRGIQYLLETPYTTAFLYKSLLKSMGISSKQKTKISNETSQVSILIAEDNQVNRIVLEGLLKKLSYNPVMVGNGKEATDAVKNKKFDIIFMDCEMPEMDGYDATKAIRADTASSKNSPVIIGLSAHSTTEYKDRAITAGMDDFMIKPVSSENIKAIIKQVNDGYFNTQDNDPEHLR